MYYVYLITAVRAEGVKGDPEPLKHELHLSLLRARSATSSLRLLCNEDNERVYATVTCQRMLVDLGTPTLLVHETIERASRLLRSINLVFFENPGKKGKASQ